MYELRHTLHSFQEALQCGEPVVLTPQGWWRKQNWTDKQFRSLLGLDVYSKMDLIVSFNAILDGLESTPINFSQMPGLVVSQEIDFHGYLNIAEVIKHSVDTEKHPNLKNLLNLLQTRVIALLYRLEEENGGLHPSHRSSPLEQQLIQEAEQWKKNAKIFWNARLSQAELHEMTETAKYQSFIKHLTIDKKLREVFFVWVLRDGLPAEVFIQYPALSEKINKNNLSGRIGRMGEGFLRLRKMEHIGGLSGQQKIVTLPFEGQDISVLDEKREIVFRGNYKTTIKNVFQTFKNKHKDLGNFEIFAEGVLNWNSNCMGWWNNDIRAYELVDLDNPFWWRLLPTLEVLTFEEANKRFRVDLDGSMWVLAAKSAREFVTLDYDGCHAYVEMAIPTPDHRYYVIYTFGKAAIQLPRNTWHRLFLFGAHVPATIVYPDETMYFSHRQQIGYTFELTEQEGMQFMLAFKEDILRARKGNMVFQIEAENCGKWLQNHLEDHLGAERVPNLYRFPVLEAEPSGFMARFFGFFKALPRFFGNYLFILSHYPLGAWRGRWVVDKGGQKVWKSLTNSSFWKDAITYLPAYMHKQHEIGIFAEGSGRHKIWTEEALVTQKKPPQNTEKSGEASTLFCDS